MSDDITLVYDEYTEKILFCKYFIANKLKHNAEMGRCGENILLEELKQRFQNLLFVTGLIAFDGIQSTQCDILVCKPSMQKRKLEGGLFLVDPKDCLMIIEVKGNLTITDFDETIRKNIFFATNNKTKHIKLMLFTYNSKVAKQTLYKKFGYKYKTIPKFYESTALEELLPLDYFICLHRDSVVSERREKQCMFIKNSKYPRQYVLSVNFPITRDFFRLIDSMQD